MIPPFERDTGQLPPGEHKAGWNEFVESFGATPHRQRLIVGLRAALEVLAAARCERVWVDGSFVTAKEHPGDFDACWDPVGVDPDLLDPVILDLSNKRAAQQAKYGGALWPADLVVESGNTILTDFQRDYLHNNRHKGIILLNLAAGLLDE